LPGVFYISGTIGFLKAGLKRWKPSYLHQTGTSPALPPEIRAMDPSVMYRARRMAHSSLAPSAPLMGEVATPLPRIWHLNWPAQGHLKRTPFATISASLKPIA
jgi:hypothetical protein